MKANADYLVSCFADDVKDLSSRRNVILRFMQPMVLPDVQETMPKEEPR